jgi:hypothetical protein
MRLEVGRARATVEVPPSPASLPRT